MADLVREVFEELNFPSEGVLKRVLKSRGIPYTNEQVAGIVKEDVVRQVQQPSYKFTGKIAAKDLNARLFLDLIDFTAAPSDGGKKVGLKPTEDNERYILVVQRVFDRMLWTAALTNKRPETVAKAFETILQEIGGTIGSITTDLGAEFGEPFRRLVEAMGIKVHTKRKEDANAISTVDAAIGNFKKALARVARKRQTDDWASILQAVTKGQNAIPKEYLDGNPPKDVENNAELRASLRRKNAEYETANQEAAKKRADALTAAGRFRVMLDAGGRFARGFKPKWSDRVYAVGRVEGAFVYDTDGKEYLTKFTQPLSTPAEDLPARRIEQRVNAQADERRERVLSDLAMQVRRFIGDRTVTLATVGKFLTTRDFRRLALEARLNMRAPVANFLRAFPDIFAVTTDRDGRSYVRVLQAAPAFPGARRLRRRL